MAFSYGYSSSYPSTYQTNAFSSIQSSLAGYGNTYRVNQPAYYTGPSYSTTSENEYPWFAAHSVYNQSVVPPTYPSGYSHNNGYSMGSCGSNYFSEPYNSYTPHYSSSYQPQQVVSAMPTSSRSQQQSSRSQSGTGSQSNIRATDSQSEDYSQLAPQIDAAYEAATGQRRQSVIKRQVITIPGQPGKVQQVVRRLPTPTPDVIERVFIVKPQRDTVNLIIERPSTPPAQYKDKTVYGKQRRPLINPKIIQVPSRQTSTATSSYYPYYSAQAYSQYSPYNVQALPMQQQGSTSSSYQFGQSQQPAMSQVSQPKQQQQQQYTTQPTMSQGHSSHHSQSHSQSQSQISDASQTRLSDRLSQHQVSPPQPKSKGAYLVAPVKYEESPVSCTQQMSYQSTPMVSSPLTYPSYGGYTSGYSGMPAYYSSSYPATPYGTRIY